MKKKKKKKKDSNNNTTDATCDTRSVVSKHTHTHINTANANYVSRPFLNPRGISRAFFFLLERNKREKLCGSESLKGKKVHNRGLFPEIIVPARKLNKLSTGWLVGRSVSREIGNFGKIIASGLHSSLAT